MQLAFYQPLHWLGLVLVLGVGYAVSLVDRPRPLKVASFVCRAGAVVLLALALCRPFVLRESRDLHGRCFRIGRSACCHRGRA